jgi:hypothetical protein
MAKMGRSMSKTSRRKGRRQPSPTVTVAALVSAVGALGLVTVAARRARANRALRALQAEAEARSAPVGLDAGI